MTIDCVRPIQSISVIKNIHRNVFLKCIFHLPKCLLVIIITYWYFIRILQGSVETHFWCGGINDNHIVANCPQSVPSHLLWCLHLTVCAYCDVIMTSEFIYVVIDKASKQWLSRFRLSVCVEIKVGHFKQKLFLKLVQKDCFHDCFKSCKKSVRY